MKRTESRITDRVAEVMIVERMKFQEELTRKLEAARNEMKDQLRDEVREEFKWEIQQLQLREVWRNREIFKEKSPPVNGETPPPPGQWRFFPHVHAIFFLSIKKLRRTVRFHLLLRSFRFVCALLAGRLGCFSVWKYFWSWKNRVTQTVSHGRMSVDWVSWMWPTRFCISFLFQIEIGQIQRLFTSTLTCRNILVGAFLGNRTEQADRTGTPDRLQDQEAGGKWAFIGKKKPTFFARRGNMKHNQPIFSSKTPVEPESAPLPIAFNSNSNSNQSINQSSGM